MLAGYAHTAVAAGEARVGLSYHRDDPYAVQLFVCTWAGPTQCWVFARDLLSDGLAAPVGLGDVGVYPGVCCELTVRLGRGDDAIWIELPKSPVRDFINETLSVVRRGHEPEALRCDIVGDDAPELTAPRPGCDQGRGQVGCDPIVSASASSTAASASRTSAAGTDGESTAEDDTDAGG